MELTTYYTFIGMIVFWLCGIIGTVLLLGFIYTLGLRHIHKLWAGAWWIAEYAYYHKEFKLWFKQQNKKSFRNSGKNRNVGAIKRD